MADVEEDDLPDQSATITLTDFLRSVIAASDSGIVTVQSILDLFQGAGTALTDIQSAAGDMDADDTAYGEEDGNPRKFTRPQIVSASSVDAAGAVMESDYNAHTVLVATSDNTPVPITMGASTILARLAAGNIIAATPAELRTLLDVSVSGDTVLKSLFDANTILAANSDNTPAAVTVAEQRVVGRVTGGNITALTPAQIRSINGLGVVDSDTGATVASTTAQTTLLNSGPLVRPIPEVGDLYQLDAAGSVLNLSGGACTYDIRFTFGTDAFWTAYTNSVGGANIASFLVSAQIYVRAVSATVGQEVLTARIDWNDDSAETLKSSATRFRTQLLSNLNNSGTTNITATTTMSVNNALTQTILQYCTITRLR